jgi:hypothetical protein
MGELARTGPVCGWYAGLALLSNPATEADGLRAMHRALLAGADRYLPVTPQLRQAVETQYARLPP